MDDFNFDSLDLGSRTWSPPSYIAIAPPIVTRDKGQAQSRCDRCIHEGPVFRFLVWCHWKPLLHRYKSSFRAHQYALHQDTTKSSRHPPRVYSLHQSQYLWNMRDNNFTGAQFVTTSIRQCLSRYNGQRSRRSESKSKKAGRKESPASQEASQLLGSSQGSSCSDGEASLGPSSAPASGRTSEAGGSKAGSKGPRPMPPLRKPHTAETLQVRFTIHLVAQGCICPVACEGACLAITMMCAFMSPFMQGCRTP